MRLFVALDIPDDIRGRIARFADGVRGFAEDARWVRPDSLHVTLKFIGEQPESQLEALGRVLSAIHSAPVKIHFRGYGFFPTPKSARVFWIGLEAGPLLASLAGAVDGALSSLGIAKEERAFSPHLTLARASGGPGAPGRHRSDGSSSTFAHLQEKLLAWPSPDFGTMTAREFFLYQSQLSPKGSRYAKLARFAGTETRE
jgi:2'-5' RNA ligase